MKHILHTLFAFLLALALLPTGGCSRKNNSWVSRTYHENTSRFNPYFNGEQALIEGVATLESSHKEDYDEILPVYIWGTAESAQAITPKMDRAQEKGTKVIKDHSMMIGGKQRNSYVIRAYILIAKARFYKHDFIPALETFNYVIQQFGKDKKATDYVNESKLWAARSQLMIGNNNAAENLLVEMIEDKRLDDKMRSQAYATIAQVYINDKKYADGVASLKESIRLSKKKQDKIRYTYIIAQLEERQTLKYEAGQSYKQVIAMKPNNYDLYFTAQLNRAKNFDAYMENSGAIYRELEKMLKDDKNLDYQDQIYYVMAQVALAEEDFEKGEVFLKQSIRASTTNTAQKGTSYLAVAEINFTFKEYVEAQAYYDSASTTLPANHKKLAYATKRKESLLGLVNNLKTITLEDSLQKLAGFSPEKQRKMFEDFVVKLREDDERARREKEMQDLNQQLVLEGKNANDGPTVGGGGGWYFYNSTTRGSGISSFSKTWGTRKLEDNWRQKNKVAENEETDPNNTNAGTDSTQTKPAGGGKYDIETYLSQIPKTEAEIDSSKSRVMVAYMNLGSIYKEELKDTKEAIKSYTTLLSRFPANRHEPKALYSLYRIYIGEKNEAEATKLKNELIAKYPTSKYARLLSDPGQTEQTNEQAVATEKLYQSVFAQYKKNEFKAAHERIVKEKATYINSGIAPKFALLDALCLGRMRKEAEFIAALKFVIETYPNTPESAQAKSILDLTDGGDADSTSTTDPNSGEGNFTYDSSQPHKYLVLIPNKGVDINLLRNAFSDFNQQYFKLENLQMQNIFFDQTTQMVVVSGFANAAKAKVYYKSVLNHPDIMKYLPNGSNTKLIISENNYKDLYKDKNLVQYLNFLKSKYQITESK